MTLHSGKTWWAPVRQGLVVDPDGKHYRKMKIAVWLYFYLALHADWATGRLRCKLTTAQRKMGIPLRTLQRWMARLQREGYITVEKTGRAALVGIKRWKPLRSRSKSAGLPRPVWRPSSAKSDARSGLQTR